MLSPVKMAQCYHRCGISAYAGCVI